MTTEEIEDQARKIWDDLSEEEESEFRRRIKVRPYKVELMGRKPNAHPYYLVDIFLALCELAMS